jgi:hypothetical protein
MSIQINNYNSSLAQPYKQIAIMLSSIIDKNLANSQSKIWHAHPVWFINNNPIVGYSVQKKGLRLMFWSGASFNEPCLNVLGNKFKDASVFYNSMDEIIERNIINCLHKAIIIQWDYKNIVKRKGVLLKLEGW